MAPASGGVGHGPASPLSRGMQGLKIRMTRRLNRLWGTRGTIFSERYHDEEITTPRQARNVLHYVIGNYRKHCAQRGVKLKARWVDPFSSARQLDGWNQPVRREPGVVEAPRTWLLRTGWKRCSSSASRHRPRRARIARPVRGHAIVVVVVSAIAVVNATRHAPSRHPRAQTNVCPNRSRERSPSRATPPSPARAPR